MKTALLNWGRSLSISHKDFEWRIAVLFFPVQSSRFIRTFFTSSSDVKQEEIINAVV